LSEPRPIRETVHLAATQDGSSGGDASGTFASEVDRLAQEFRSRLVSAAAEAEGTLRHEVARRLEEEFDENFNAGIRMVRREMGQRMEDARTEWDRERAELNRQITELIQTTDAGRIHAELQKTETPLARLSDEVDAMVEDANIRLSDVMHKNIRTRRTSCLPPGTPMSGRKQRTSRGIAVSPAQAQFVRALTSFT
jgi:hypothetical protein